MSGAYGRDEKVTQQKRSLFLKRVVHVIETKRAPGRRTESKDEKRKRSTEKYLMA